MHYIKIGDFVVNDTTYPNRCLSENFGDNTGCIPCDTIPWEGTEHNPWDYKWENDAFILDEIDIPEPEPEPTETERLRADVDYLLMITE